MFKNKKNIMLISFIVVVIIISIFLLIKKDNYEVVMKKIDSYSPDRTLKVYKNDKEIHVNYIKYLDGVLIASGENLVASYADIKDERELIVVLKNNKEVKAKLVKEEE